MTAIDRARARGATRRATVQIVTTNYRPWSAQAWLHRSRAVFRNVVAGRQSGKSHAGAFETLQAVLWKSTREDGRHAAVLAPTYRIARSAIAKLREFAEGVIPGAAWKAQEKQLELPGGRLVSIFSADRKETVRGPTLCLVWIDEGAYLHSDAREAALGALSAVQDARVLVTTTPAGKNWVFREFTSPDDASESFRFRTEDSPYANRALVARLRAKMSPEKAEQEFDAVFVDSLLLAFPDTSRLLVRHHRARQGASGNVIGLDVARDQDWTVATLMNRWGDAEILGRRQKSGSEATFYPQTVAWVAGLAKKHGAAVCIDNSGPGAVVADYLEREHGVTVVRVDTHVGKHKTAIVEACRAEVQADRIRVLENEHSDQLVDELTKFQGVVKIQHGQATTVYEGIQGIEGEHDDCVISLCLANWGRRDTREDPLAGDFSGFGGHSGGPRWSLPGTRPPGPAGPGPSLHGGFGGIGR